MSRSRGSSDRPPGMNDIEKTPHRWWEQGKGAGAGEVTRGSDRRRNGARHHRPRQRRLAGGGDPLLSRLAGRYSFRSGRSGQYPDGWPIHTPIIRAFGSIQALYLPNGLSQRPIHVRPAKLAICIFNPGLAEARRPSDPAGMLGYDEPSRYLLPGGFMTEWIWFNGETILMADARIGVEDRGFQFADGVYEVVRIYDGKLFTLADHLQLLSAPLGGR